MYIWNLLNHKVLIFGCDYVSFELITLRISYIKFPIHCGLSASSYNWAPKEAP